MDGVEQASASATSTTFVGVIGQEFSTINGGNHVNILRRPLQIPNFFNSNYRAIFGQRREDFQIKNLPEDLAGRPCGCK